MQLHALHHIEPLVSVTIKKVDVVSVHRENLHIYVVVNTEIFHNKACLSDDFPNLQPVSILLRHLPSIYMECTFKNCRM